MEELLIGLSKNNKYTPIFKMILKIMASSVLCQVMDSIPFFSLYIFLLMRQQIYQTKNKLSYVFVGWRNVIS